MDKMKILNELQSHYDYSVELFGEEKVLAVMLYGSQNYGLATEASDFDTCALIVPSVDDIILGKQKKSKHYKLDNGIMNVKDYRLAFENYLKGGFTFLETLYTDYYIVNPYFKNEFNQLREMADEIVNYTYSTGFYSSVKGLLNNIIKNYNKHKDTDDKDEIVTINKRIRQFFRIYYFMKDFQDTEDFKWSLDANKNNRSKLYEEIAQATKDLKVYNKVEDFINAELDSSVFIPKEKNINNKAEEKLEVLVLKIFDKIYNP